MCKACKACKRRNRQCSVHEWKAPLARTICRGGWTDPAWQPPPPLPPPSFCFSPKDHRTSPSTFLHLLSSLHCSLALLLPLSIPPPLLLLYSLTPHFLPVCVPVLVSRLVLYPRHLIFANHEGRHHDRALRAHPARRHPLGAHLHARAPGQQGSPQAVAWQEGPSVAPQRQAQALLHPLAGWRREADPDDAQEIHDRERDQDQGEPGAGQDPARSRRCPALDGAHARPPPRAPARDQPAHAGRDLRLGAQGDLAIALAIAHINAACYIALTKPKSPRKCMIAAACVLHVEVRGMCVGGSKFARLDHVCSGWSLTRILLMLHCILFASCGFYGFSGVF
ncbi:uncharacterized protein COLE_07001 [Cutaneotrichosporon oleaginosum]|uniref:uncharacterized protein n=1 Tax=Cutaneotrichosporon oleaginosum TaxID=879819 RepID=UPI00132C88F4|nr:hypothetical protein COLE_07001 [Cutaneotrichosporon oleaginosum]